MDDVPQGMSGSKSGGMNSNGNGSSNGNGNGNGKQRNSRQVGDWVLGKTLGAGSMGKVKLATNLYTKEKVSRCF